VTNAKLTIYRRHSQKCVASGAPTTAICDCTIWIRGRVSAESEPIRYSLETSEIATANRMMRDLIHGVDPRSKPSSLTVGEAVTRWILLRVEHPDLSLAAGTIVSYKGAMQRLVQAIGDMPIGAVTQETINDYRATHRQHVSDGTWLLDLTILRMFFVWCADSPRSWIFADPTKGVPRPKQPQLCTPPLDDDEVACIIDACDRFAESRPGLNPNQQYARQRVRALVSLLLNSGLRISDAALLRRNALNPKTGHLTLRTLKTGISIKVQLSPETVKLLVALPSDNPEYFFWSGNCNRKTICDTLYRAIVRVGEIAAINGLHPHRFRDTFAVALLSEGTDIRTVQKLLGHSSVVMTERHYAHFVDRHQSLLDAATARLNFERPRTPVLLKPVARRRKA
jgi:integrase